MFFKRFIWRSTLSIGQDLERFTTWTLTGVGATAALIVSNVDGVSRVVTDGGVQAMLLLMAASLICGVVSKQIGMATNAGMTKAAEVEELLASADGQNLMNSMTVQPTQLRDDVAEPFLWPLAGVLRRAHDRAVKDPLAGGRRFIHLFMFQLYFFWAHGLLALISLPVVALTIR